jgi:hypothetical protein
MLQQFMQVVYKFSMVDFIWAPKKEAGAQIATPES